MEEEYFAECPHSGQPGRQPCRFPALPRDAAPQFSAIYRGTARFADRDVDAIHRTTLARLQIDWFGGPAGRVRIRQPSADTLSRVDWRIRRRPLQPASRGHVDADRFDDSGICVGGAYAAENSYGFGTG